MKITRNGVEIELTKQEIFNAYEEQQAEYNNEMIEEYLSIRAIEPPLSDTEKAEMLVSYNNNFHHDCDDGYSISCALCDVLDERKKK